MSRFTNCVGQMFVAVSESPQNMNLAAVVSHEASATAANARARGSPPVTVGDPLPPATVMSPAMSAGSPLMVRM